MSETIRERIEVALRAEFETALPKLVEAVVRRLAHEGDGSPPPPAKVQRKRSRVADLDALEELFRIARTEGEGAVRVRLDKSLEEILPVARALDRVLADKLRKTKNRDRVIDTVVAEVLRRAHRLDVHLGSSDPGGETPG